MDRNLKNRLRTAALILFALLFIGTSGYYFLTGEDDSLFDCFYMTVITITTIGFEEVIDLEGNIPARLFTVFIAFSGIGFISFFISTISSIFLEGTIRDTYKTKKMNKDLYSTSRHYIICGLGRNSIHLLDELISTNRDVAAIELNKSVLQEVLIKYPHLI